MSSSSPERDPAAATTRALGQAAEALAVRHLEGAGLQILARNVALAGGELDVIALDVDRTPHEVVFVEVRSRATTRLGTPLETISLAKRRKIIRAAAAWLVGQGLHDKVAARFDVMELVTTAALDDETSRLAGADATGAVPVEVHRPTGPSASTSSTSSTSLTWIRDAFQRDG